MRKKIRIATYFLAALLLSGLLLHAGKNSKGLYKYIRPIQQTETENVIVKSKEVKAIERFLPSVLMF